MSIINGFHHASLITGDLERALEFYLGVLKLSLDPNRPGFDFPGAWLQVGDRQIHLLQLPNPDPVEGRPAHAGRDRHLAFAVSDLESLQAALEGAGVAYTRSRSGRRALFCRDPDGNGLEFVEQAESTPTDRPNG